MPRRKLGGIFVPSSVSGPFIADFAIMGDWDAREALKPRFEFVSEEVHILQDILV